MSKSIGIINKVRNLLNKEILINLYYVFIYPYITYCNVIWGRAPNTYLPNVHILQKRVLRIISHAGFKCHTQPLFCRYKILNIYQANKYLCCMLMYKHKTGMLPHIGPIQCTVHTKHHPAYSQHKTIYRILDRVLPNKHETKYNRVCWPEHVE